MAANQEIHTLNDDEGSLTESSDLKLEEVEKNIRVLITKLKGAHMNEDGSRVDYRNMSNSEMFGDYCKEVAKLKFIRPEKYGEDKRKAFFINIYNSLTIHAMVYQASAGNLPDSPMKVKGFWRIHAYNIGGLVYNLDEIEHGVLRRNKGHPNAGKQEFSDDDPRAKVSLTSLDPRIHFALNCGARSCPPIRVYTEDRIEAQLDTASRSFLDQEVSVSRDPVTGKWNVELSKLFLWYGADFGDSPEAVLAWISAHLSPGLVDTREVARDGFTITHRDYNWTANSES